MRINQSNLGLGQFSNSLLMLVFSFLALFIGQLRVEASGSLYFDGTTNSFMQWNGPFGSNYLDYTLEFWAKPYGATSQNLFEYYDPGNYTFLNLTESENSIRLDSYWGFPDCQTMNYSFASAFGLLPNQWQHVALVRNAHAVPLPNSPFTNFYFYGVSSIYINGELVATNIDPIYSDPHGDFGCSGPLDWSQIPGPVLAQGFTGEIGEFREWNRALSQSEIQTKMTEVLIPSNEVGLVGYWRFTEGQGNVVHDLAGTDDAMIYGASWSAEFPNTTIVPPQIVQEPINTTEPNGATNVSINVFVIGSQPLKYQWMFNGTNIADTNIFGVTSNVLTIGKLSTNYLGLYAVTITNPAGTITSSNAALTMFPYFSTAFSGATFIWGQDGLLIADAGGTGPFNFQWLFDGVSILGATNQTFTIPSIQFTNAGFYSVIVSSAFGSVTNLPAQVVVNPAGVAISMYPGITINGTVGYNYAIQSVPNLTETNGWQTLTNLTLQLPQQIWFDASTPANSANPQKFYRVLPLQ